jgi:hypothetical protein
MRSSTLFSLLSWEGERFFLDFIEPFPTEWIPWGQPLKYPNYTQSSERLIADYVLNARILEGWFLFRKELYNTDLVTTGGLLFGQFSVSEQIIFTIS